MKLARLTAAIAATAVALTGSLASSSPANAQARPRFFCASKNGIPTTVVRMPNGSEISIIEWKSEHLVASGFTPQARCEIVSGRFQSFHARGMLNYLTAGIMNGQGVICATDKEGGSCTELLFTPKPGSDPSTVLVDLMQLRSRATGKPILETGARPYINVDEFLQDLSANSVQ